MPPEEAQQPTEPKQKPEPNSQLLEAKQQAEGKAVNSSPNIQAEQDREKEVQETPIPESIVSRIYQALEERKYQGQLPLVIKEGLANVVFEAQPGKEPTTNAVTPHQLSLIQKTIEDPLGLKKGSIRIYVGDEKVFHVNSKDGIVTDKLGLISEQAKTQEASQNVAETKPTLHPRAVAVEEQSLKEQINELQELVKKQQDQIKSLTEWKEKFNSAPALIAINAGDRVSEWLDNFHAKLKQSAQEAVQEAVKQVSDKLEHNKRNLVDKARTFFQDLAARATTKVETVRDNVATRIEVTQENIKQKVGEAAVGLVGNALKTVVNRVGERLPDGSVAFQSATSNQSFQVTDGSVNVATRSADPQAMWDKYSQGIEAKAPNERTLGAVLNARSAGESRLNILQMIHTSDPESSYIKQQYNPEIGSKKAFQYAEAAYAKAIRQERGVGQQPTKELQASRQNEADI